MTMTPTGSRVKKTDLERLDLDDFHAAQDLPLMATAEAQGAIIGRRDEGTSVTYYGLASGLTYDGSNLAAVTFGPFKFWAPSPGYGTRAPGPAALVTYERITAVGAAFSTVSLDLSDAILSERPFLWARRVQDDGGELIETRVFFDELTEVEYEDSTRTRLVDYVILGMSPPGSPLSKPDENVGWVPIARARAGDGSTVVFHARSALDIVAPALENEASTLTAVAANMDRNRYGGSAEALGLPSAAEATGTYMQDGSVAGAVGAVFAVLGKIFDGRLKVNRRTFQVENTNFGAISIDGWRTWLNDEAFPALLQLRQRISDRTMLVAALAYSYNVGTSEYEFLAGHYADGFASALSAPTTTTLGAGKRLSITLTTRAGWEVWGYDAKVHRALNFTDPTMPIDIIVAGSLYGATSEGGSVTVQAAGSYKTNADNDSYAFGAVDMTLLIFGGPVGEF